MSTKSPKSLIPEFFDDTAATYDKIVAWMTFGKDHYWKKEMLRQIPKADSYLDLACGTGILTRKIATKFPGSKVVGVDISSSYLVVAKKNSTQYKNISFIKEDAEHLDLHEKFDCIVSSYIPKYCNASVLVKVCSEHIKDDGKIILHDFTYPKNILLQELWSTYFIMLRFVAFFIPSWKNAFYKLPDLIRASSWLDDYESELKKHGFSTTRRMLTWGTSAMLVGIK